MDQNYDAASELPVYQACREVPSRTRENDRKGVEHARNAHAFTKDKRIKSDAKNPSATVEEYREDLTVPYKPCTLALDRIYDESRWTLPEDHEPGAKKEPKSGVRFPLDEALVLDSIEDQTHINMDDADIRQLVADLQDIKSKSASDITDVNSLSLKYEYGDKRSIEKFILHGRTIARVKFEDAEVGEKNYKQVMRGKKLEKDIDRGTNGKQQADLKIENYVTAHILLCLGGEVGARAQDSWRAARNFSQQQLELNPGLEEIVMKKLDEEHDPALKEMLEVLNDVHQRKESSPYHQAMRDKWGVDHNLFDRIAHTDIVMVLDKNNEVIFLQLSDSFQKLLQKQLEDQVVKAFEIYSTLHAVPFPDSTRHGIHWSEWLLKRPELDFRNSANILRMAKSGPFHIGCGNMTGDTHGDVKGPTLKADSKRNIERYPHIVKQQETLRYGALGACTEILKLLLSTVAPELCTEYENVARELAERYEMETGTNLFETRREGGIFTMRAILINLLTTDHKDQNDWSNGFAGLVAVGDHEGGDLLLRELGLRIEARSGAAQLMRGRELAHSIDFYTGRRFCVVCVTREANRKWAEKRMQSREQPSASSEQSLGSNEQPSESREQASGSTEQALTAKKRKNSDVGSTASREGEKRSKKL
ncbi:uncharacterized protein LY89DRAFT_755905 [Mollisia scopiformis]|uniref:Uncharacterized protein n=1 Tax=Mollisia scopiformis TaxID=149040 RepID=A0A194WXW5_MOLSC|nr:uncharacterized protein LY89DRAFT_755905 [Mollisia scopiformis]KUJ12813.1 hypothetical protein LY89DRAFT_755905 [Mollisia scopiformis]